MTDEEIVKYARGVITQEYMLADIRDRDWNSSLMLIMSGIAESGGFPANASCLFLVPMASHQNGRWLNGRVPALTTNCTMVPVESVEALITQCDAFYAALHPEEAAAQGQSDTTD
jgi:hypothetical protein